MFFFLKSDLFTSSLPSSPKFGDSAQASVQPLLQAFLPFFLPPSFFFFNLLCILFVYRDVNE
jgi:hypothetical protein